MRNRSYVLGFDQADKSKLDMVGGKGANLGELSKIEGLHVPSGFCVTTDAFRELLFGNDQLNSLIDRLNVFLPEDRKNITEVSSIIRSLIEKIPVGERLASEISDHLLKFDKKTAFAIRSSATAEDLPTASFAGQQDTYLNIIGRESILKHISKCWASLFTERAVTYRIQHKFDHKKVYLSVIVQKMIFPQSSGILFTADPVTFNRKVLSIDAGFGLGEALVSGQVNPDIYKVRDEKIIDKKISLKKIGIYAMPEGGTQEQSINASEQNNQALTDEQVLELARIGRNIENHFGRPQDIEWCLSEGRFYIVQSRPITTLFPIPVVNDNENHVYVSVGHQQMMTDAMKPLALSLWTTRSKLVTAGGRLFVDLTMGLASPGRQNVLDVLGQSDPLIKDALLSILDRGDFIKTVPLEDKPFTPIKSAKGMSAADILALVGNDKNLVNELIESSERSLQSLTDNMANKSGSEVFKVIFDDIDDMRKGIADTRMLSAITAAINAAVWINEKMNEWLGEKGVADVISLSVPNNVTSEMGLALLDVADAIRPFPDVINYLRQTTNDNFLDDLPKIKGGKESREAIVMFLNKYGMRCAGEIDITRARWLEKPLILVPLILTNIKNVEPGSSKRNFEEGKQLALKKRDEIINRLKQLPDGEVKAEEARQMIDHVRNFAGYREYPKFAIVNRYFIYKQALMKEAGRLVGSGVIHDREDVYYLTLQEFNEVVDTNKVDYELINQRKEEFKLFEKLTPPRVLTSEGEAVAGKYRREDLPSGAIVGLPVSSGIVEGRARVILNMEDANLEEGDILVTTFTDPSWTPLFVSIRGLVTEVGGLMTHGAVVAREYGLPAVVGVENATKLIKDGQKIRVNGRDGYVEII